MPNGKPGDQVPYEVQDAIETSAAAARPAPGGLTALMPSRQAKLKIWAIRSVIVLVAAAIFVSAGVGTWFLWAALAYVAVTLVLAFVLTRPQGGSGSE